MKEGIFFLLLGGYILFKGYIPDVLYGPKQELEDLKYIVGSSIAIFGIYIIFNLYKNKKP